SLRVCAAIGWPNDAKTRAPLSPSATSHAQYTLQSKDPVIINDVRTDARFSMSETLRDHGIRSGISVTIPGHGKPWGVLDAHSTQVGAFSVNDLGFLYSVANVLATAIRSSPANQPGAKWLSIRDVSDILRVKDETVRRWIRRGELPIIDLGSSRAGYRVHPSDLDYFIQERYMKP
ncbi:MAG TPA: helix-turn-helix domain-containing protein, partial [Thermomicrobiales bacterium]|nr:helix-turn-helix domain-containing protein [Thermomicrobiales bacterium]